MGLQAVTTVIAAAQSYDLVALDVVRDELRLTDRSNDVQLKRYISSASAAAAQYCNRVFPVETVQDDFWPERDFYPYQVPGGVQPLQLSRWPVTEITSVVENGETLVADTDFTPNKANGWLVRYDVNQYPKAWPAWKITVTYKAGYAAIPPDVADAVVRMVKARWLARGRDPYLRQENIPGVREVQYWIATGSEAGNMPPDVMDILENYRVPVVG